MSCGLNLELGVIGGGEPLLFWGTRTRALLSWSLSLPIAHHNLSLEVGVGGKPLVARETEQACPWP